MSLTLTIPFVSDAIHPLHIVLFKESYSTANEGKRQLNRFIIYNLDSIVRVNDNPKL